MKRSTSMSNLESLLDPEMQLFSRKTLPRGRLCSEEVQKKDCPKDLSSISRSVDDLLSSPFGSDAQCDLSPLNASPGIRLIPESISSSRSGSCDAFDDAETVPRARKMSTADSEEPLEDGKEGYSILREESPVPYTDVNLNDEGSGEKSPLISVSPNDSFVSVDRTSDSDEDKNEWIRSNAHLDGMWVTTNTHSDRSTSDEQSALQNATRKNVSNELISADLLGALDSVPNSEMPNSHSSACKPVPLFDFTPVVDVSPSPSRFSQPVEDDNISVDGASSALEQLMIKSTISSHPIDEDETSPAFRVLGNEATSSDTLRSGVESPTSFDQEPLFSLEPAHELAAISEQNIEHYEEDPVVFSQSVRSESEGTRNQRPLSQIWNDWDRWKNDVGDDLQDKQLQPTHRRWLSDHSQGPSEYKKRLDEQLKREQEADEVDTAVRHISTRNGTLTNRCKSQLILGCEPCDMGPQQSPLESLRSLSTSSPSVNDGSSAEGIVSDAIFAVTTSSAGNAAGKNAGVLNRKDAKKWSQMMPPTFGPHQVISSVQRPARLIPSAGAVVDSSARLLTKARVEKKQVRKSGGILDLLAIGSYRKRKIDPCSGRGNAAAHVIDRRSTMSDGPIEGLPDCLVNTLQERQGRPYTIGVSEGRSLAANIRQDRNEFVPQINKPKWMDLDLWSSEPPSWSLRNSHIKLSAKEKKKQNVIHELYVTEKHYCQVLVILQQVYQEGLRVRNLLSESERNELIPAVLDALLDFHISFLRKIRSKRNECVVVDSVSQIVYSEFDESSERSRAAVHAYTEICSRKDRCGRLYDDWVGKSPMLRKFFDEFEKNPKYKERTFKMCLLLIAQRLTKYPVLLSQLHELESDTGKGESLRAHAAVKNFAFRVDTELAKIEINRRWDRIRTQMNRSSIGRINQNDLFTYDDLVLNGAPDQRKVVCIGSAQCHNLAQKDPVEVILVLFDDILVILTNVSNKNEKYAFCDRGPSWCSVIGLKTLMVRDMPRQNTSFYLLVDATPCCDLFVFTFASKCDLAQWKRAIESAKERAPSYIRRAARVTEESIIELKEEDPEEVRFNMEMDTWESQLREIFEKRKRKEGQYMDERLKWFDEVYDHVSRIPVKNRSDFQKSVVSEKIRALVKEKFGELRTFRRASFNKVAEDALRINLDDFQSFFSGTQEAAVSTSDSSPSSDQSESDETRLKLPRRNRTFHGTGDRHKDSSIRRHTTEPKLAECRQMGKGEELAAIGDEEIHKLPLGLSSYARRAASRIVKENVQLRIECNRLRSEVVRQELHVASLKTRRSAATPVTALEALRKKQLEVQSQQTACDTRMQQISIREKELYEKEKELKAREDQLQEQWQKFAEMNSTEVMSLHRPLGCPRPFQTGNSFRSGSAIHEHASLLSPRQAQPSQLGKSASSSSMPLHLAEKSAKIARTRKT